MVIITNNAIKNWYSNYPQAQTALLNWYKEVASIIWATPNEVKNYHAKASIIGNNTVVFNIKNNEYRLVTDVNYKRRTIFLIWFGTHKEYDKIDVLTVTSNADHSTTN